MSVAQPIDPAIINGTSISTATSPLHPQAIILPLVAFPSWILCIPPLAWHVRQGNIAAGSLILWVMMANFFLSVNPLIWPRDNLYEWWDGNVWCDVHSRIQVGAAAGTTASAAMIVRKLARVMDTSNMIVSSSRNTKLKEKVLEILWCWVYPLVLIIVYYVVQPVRYIIYGIIGCLAAYDTSWPSIVLSFMWGPITTLVAACYAGILSYRLYRYRREFVRLVAARNTTKSRFIRLFIICVIVIVVYVPYTLYLLASLFKAVVDPYDWDRVHDPVRFNSIIRAPAYGQVTVDRWGQIATGYVIFFVFGTGADAHATYKKMLLAVGLGMCFPSLYIMRESGSSTPSSFIAARTWTSTISSKAKNMFCFRTVSITNTFNRSMRNNSVVLGSTHQLRPVTTEETMPKSPRDASPSQPSLFNRMFNRQDHRGPVLPLFSRCSITELTNASTDKSLASSTPPSVSVHAWTTDMPSPRRISETDDVHVVPRSTSKSAVTPRGC